MSWERPFEADLQLARCITRSVLVPAQALAGSQLLAQGGHRPSGRALTLTPTLGGTLAR